MIDYDSFSRCHLTDILFRFSRGSVRVNSNTVKSCFIVTLTSFKGLLVY